MRSRIVSGVLTGLILMVQGGRAGSPELALALGRRCLFLRLCRCGDGDGCGAGDAAGDKREPGDDGDGAMGDAKRGVLSRLIAFHSGLLWLAVVSFIPPGGQV